MLCVPVNEGLPETGCKNQLKQGFCPRLTLLTNAAAFCKVNAYSSIGANKLSVCGNIETIKTAE